MEQQQNFVERFFDEAILESREQMQQFLLLAQSCPPTYYQFEQLATEEIFLQQLESSSIRGDWVRGGNLYRQDVPLREIAQQWEMGDTVFNLPSDEIFKTNAERSDGSFHSTLITKGNAYTKPHCEEMLASSLAFLPPWAKCIKLWFTFKHHDHRNYRHECRVLWNSARHGSITKSMEVFRKEGLLEYLQIFLMLPGQLLSMPFGTTHSVLTLFERTDEMKVCILGGYVSRPPIELARIYVNYYNDAKVKQAFLEYYGVPFQTRKRKSTLKKEQGRRTKKKGLEQLNRTQ